MIALGLDSVPTFEIEIWHQSKITYTFEHRSEIVLFVLRITKNWPHFFYKKNLQKSKIVLIGGQSVITI